MKSILVLTIFTLLHVNYCLSQHDASFTYIDIIAKCNMQVQESRNQHIVNWDEVPINISGVSRIKQVHYRFQIDPTTKSDTIVSSYGNLDTMVMIYSREYKFDKSNAENLSITIDGWETIKYKNNRLLSKEEEGAIVNYNYYSTGLLKSIDLNGRSLLVSEEIGNTVKYEVILTNRVSKKIIPSDLIPKISVLCTLDSSGCFRYENILVAKRLYEKPIVNKQIIQCTNGNMIKEVILDRFYKYKKKVSDYEFVYVDSKLIRKNWNSDVPNQDYRNVEYQYGKNENMRRLLGIILLLSLDMTVGII